ncbi:CD22 [Acanthosepion pharaonis]|uniref:CD22 n=1 Tax=Acanthosepion pharaonis TaxID=158019 RepID=A0A812C8T5_ACAPH|nr:CD22 [Sepia pharaonis]
MDTGMRRVAAICNVTISSTCRHTCSVNKQMMNLILFVLLHLIVSVQSKITAKNKTLLIKAGDPFTLQCDDPSAKWKLNEKIISNCENCHSSKCNIDEAYKNRITAFCRQGYSVLHFNLTQIGDKGSLQCPESDSTTFQILVGNYNITHFHSENKFSFALKQKSYTLQKKGTFHIKQVSLSQDGNMIGCESAGQLYLFHLTVNVPVTSVSIHFPSQDLLENKDGIFVCKAEESKPEASFQWFIAYQNGSLQKIQQKFSISKTAKGKLWQTNSTLILKLKRDYKKIMCKARIENMPWTNSKDKSLDIKYLPQGKPRIILSQSGICAGKSIEIKCEWKGGKHIGKEDNVTEELDIQYPPSNVTISQTSYLEGQTASLICVASGGNPKVDNYTWSPDNYPPANVIKINLTRALNKKTLTCNGHHKCKGDNPVSSTIKLNVEYYPIINTIDNMTKKEIQKYSLKVINPVGERSFELTLDSGIPDKSYIYIIISCVIGVIVIFIIAGIVFFIYRRLSKKKESDANLVDNNNSVADGEIVNNVIYDSFSGVENNSGNAADLYAKIDKSKKTKPQDMNVNKTSKPLNKINYENTENLYANVDKLKPKSQDTKDNVADLYAKIDRSKKTKPQDMNENTADLYAKIDKSQKTQSQGKNAKKKPAPRPAQKPPAPNIKAKLKTESSENIYENLEMKEKKTDQTELMYADLEFINKANTKQDPIKTNNEDQTMYASIDFSSKEPATQ